MHQVCVVMRLCGHHTDDGVCHLSIGSRACSVRPMLSPCDAGEAGVEPVVGRRVWVGADPPVELERQRDDLVRSTVPVYNRGAWMPPDQMIVHGDEEAVA